MSSIKSAFGKLNQRKLKVFLLFLLCSFLAWAISKLSEVYESRANFRIVHQNIPDSLLLNRNSNRLLTAKIKASGFQFLGYSLSPKSIVLDLGGVLEQEGEYFLTANTVKNQMERQLPNSVSLMELDAPIFYTDLYRVDFKHVPVLPKINLRLAQNHLLKGPLKVSPDSIRIRGPKKHIGKVREISTVPFELNEVSTNFSRELALESLDSLGNIVIDTKKVTVSGEVVRFSEKEFVIGIKTRHVPEGFRLRTFPDHITIVCKAGIEQLKDLKTTDFEVFVDYDALVDKKYLFIELEKKPDDVFSVRLLQNRVEFVLEKI